MIVQFNDVIAIAMMNKTKSICCSMYVLQPGLKLKLALTRMTK